MKQSRLLLFVIAALVPAGLQVPFVAGQAGLAIDVRAGVPGEVVQLPIDFTNDGTIVAIQFDVTFDSAVLTAQDPLPGEGLADHVVAFNQLEDGLWRVVVYSPTNNLLGSGTAVLLPLSVNAAAPVGLHPVDFSDPVILSAAEGVALAPVSIFRGGVSLGTWTWMESWMRKKPGLPTTAMRTPMGLRIANRLTWLRFRMPPMAGI